MAYSSPNSPTTYVLWPLWNLRYNTSLEEVEKLHHPAYSWQFKRCLGNSVLPLCITMCFFPPYHPSFSKFLVLHFGRAASVFANPSLTSVSSDLTPEILEERSSFSHTSSTPPGSWMYCIQAGCGTMIYMKYIKEIRTYPLFVPLAHRA